MNRFRLAFVALLASVAASAGEPSQLKCDIGPVTKTYGSAKWLVYSCSDNSSLVIVSAPGNPASPFYFMLQSGPKGYRLQGEGAGNAEVTAEASRELKALTKHDIAALLAETRSVQK